MPTKYMNYEQQDYQKFFVKDPKNFSPERNRYIINKTIEEYEKNQLARKKKQEEGLMERVDAAASYLMYLERGGTSAEKYFGKRELARLQGKKILQKYIDVLGLSSKLVAFEEID